MIYLDDSSTTQLDQRVLQAMLPYFTDMYGNASSTHSFGQKSKYAIDEARYILADFLHSTPQEIIFTSTGSESISLALKGTAEYLATKDGFHPENVYFVTTPLEHSAVMKTISHLQAWNYKNRIVPVDDFGEVKPTGEDSLESILQDIKAENPNAEILVTVQYVNSEIGTVQNIAEISKIAHSYSAFVHTDAMQAAKYLDLNVQDLGVDMMTFAAHKIYGPLGAAALFLKSGSKISRQIDGGEQEYKIRAGTQNTPAIVGFGKAVQFLMQERDERKKHVWELSDLFSSKILSSIPGSRILCNENRMKSICAIVIPGIQAVEFLVRLDLNGIVASAGSACNSGSMQPTENLKYIGLNEQEINSVIRFSIGKNNTIEEINSAVEIIAEEYKKYTAQKTA